MMKPDLEMARRFLDVLKLDDEDVFTFQTIGEGEARGRPQLNHVIHAGFEQAQAELLHLNDQGAGVFVMINRGDGLVKEGQRTCRTADNVIAIRALFVDLDGQPLEPVVNAGPTPTMVINSSLGRFHAYWKMPGCPLDEFTLRQKQLAEKFDSDRKVCDLCRVMRVPGFFHRKKEPFMSTMMDKV